MNQVRMLNGREANIIAYFEFITTKNYYIIYQYPSAPTVLYIGLVKKNGNTFAIQLFDKQTAFIIKALVKDLTENQLTTIKAYKYQSKLSELPADFQVMASQEIRLTEETLKNVLTCLNYTEEHNQEILDQAKDEYYLKLLDEKTKERRTIIILVIILIVVLSAIATMIINFISQF